MLSLLSPFELQLELSHFVKATRQAKGYSVRSFSEKTGVPNSTIRKFENTGEVSLRQFLMMYAALGKLSDLQKLTQKIDMPKSIDEVIKNA
nr:helix-turn-helix transcriptional regulator [Colwellia maritima]|tara:strand:+ start:193 stop:465 length:273 start_codon:yes stop_codon:yes gene_type:complete